MIRCERPDLRPLLAVVVVVCLLVLSACDNFGGIYYALATAREECSGSATNEDRPESNHCPSDGDTDCCEAIGEEDSNENPRPTELRSPSRTQSTPVTR